MREPTVHLALIGRFTRHPWVELMPDRDPYSALVERAAAVGWDSVFSSLGTRPTLWGMEEAAPDWQDTTEPATVVWYQVGIDSNVKGPRPPLPVPALLSCALASTARAGHLELDGLRMDLPVHLSANGELRLHSMATWFETRDPGASGTVTIALSSRDTREVIRGRAEIEEYLAAPRLHPLVTKVRRAATSSPPDDGAMTGHRVGFTVEVAEWSPDAATFLAAAIVEACRAARVNCSVGVDIHINRHRG